MQDQAQITAARAHSQWRHVPLALFTVPMSLVGLALVLRRIEIVEGLTGLMSGLVLVLCLVSLACVLAAHAVKLLHHPDQMRADLSHPVRICFAAALPMALVLIAAALHPTHPNVAHASWLVGTVLYGAVALWGVHIWQRLAPIDLAALNPIWFLPIVGHVLIAHCGARLGYVETSWLVVGLSVPFWIILQALLFYRNIFAPPLPPRLSPTLTVQIGPAPLIFLAMAELQSGIDPLMRVLYYAGLGTALVLWLPRVPGFLRLTFAMPHWAFSFPLAALAAASLVYAERTQSHAHWIFGKSLAAVVALITLILVVLTVRAALRGTFAKPEV